ncbi:sodium-dependent bicarbonate transport family permease [Paenibacillus sp. JMULE4]|uniref:sodium-dependent bicarbonate transport family permease n=1 Tax=Paenibacillus TaxID=44249 RepID=UPI00157762AB|nr:sodium-dependent bicarbonate transport family permease [Paenibacillus sp. JMULE4]NTZ16297.1 sodium-dependent bicarbonate transport family permease [Paenibacillus sp. JMULE4]
MFDIFIANMTSPAVLFFALGLIASQLKSDLKIPKGLSETLSIYLLVAIGLKGGIELSKYPLSVLVNPIAGGLLLGMVIPLLTVFVLRMLKLDIYNAVALAATYGSVSIVTFGAAVDFLEKTGTAYETYMSAVVAIMELPALVISLILLNMFKNAATSSSVAPAKLYSSILPVFRKGINFHIIKECLSGKSVLLLLGSLMIGLLSGQDALPIVQPLFIDLYRGFLLLFLLSMGIVCGAQISGLKQNGYLLIGFALAAPLLYGTLGIAIGKAVGLSIGSSMLMGTLAASASYIAAPAALKSSVPEANPSIYLGLALGVTFPLNLAVGIPFYLWLAQALYS